MIFDLIWSFMTFHLDNVIQCNPGLLLGLIGAGLGAAGSVAGGLMNQGAISDTNETNLKMARETNEQNYKIFQEQLGFTKDMWNKSNAYNTPLEQRRRYEEAGINPYMALSNLQSGNAQTATTPAANPMQPGHVQPNTALGDMVGRVSDQIPNAVMQLGQQSMLQEQIAGQQIANKQNAIKTSYSLLREKSEIDEIIARKEKILADKDVSFETAKKTKREIKNLRQQARLMKIEFDYLSETFEARTQQQREMADRMHEEFLKAAKEREYQEMVNEAFPALNGAQMKVLAGQAASAFASANASNELAKLHGAERERAIVQKVGDILDNGIKANQYSLQQLDLTKADIEMMKAGKIKDLMKNNNTWTKIQVLSENFGDILSNVNPFKGMFKAAM